MQVCEKEMMAELMFLQKVVANQDEMIVQLNTKLLEQQWRFHAEKFDNPWSPGK